MGDVHAQGADATGRTGFVGAGGAHGISHGESDGACVAARCLGIGVCRRRFNRLDRRLSPPIVLPPVVGGRLRAMLLVGPGSQQPNGWSSRIPTRSIVRERAPTRARSVETFRDTASAREVTDQLFGVGDMAVWQAQM